MTTLVDDTQHKAEVLGTLFLDTPSLQYNVASCPICNSKQLHYAFSTQDYRVVRCADCHLLFLNPQPTPAAIRKACEEPAFIQDNSLEDAEQSAYLMAATTRLYLHTLEQYRGVHGGKLLHIGCGNGELLVQAQQSGYDVVGVEPSTNVAHIANQRVGGSRVLCGDIEQLPLCPGTYDVCVLTDVLERAREPLRLLKQVHELLKPDGVLFIVTPSLDTWTARVLQQTWMEFKPQHLTYFDTNTIQHALYQTGYEQAIVQPGRKIFTLSYIARYVSHFPRRGFTTVIETLMRIMPENLRRSSIPLAANDMFVFARAITPKPHKLSVVLPAYNEEATVDMLLSRLLLKRIPDLEIEIVIVESNSTDGTRDVVLRYQDHPRVQVILEDRPRGKGHAVRTGLEHATGDFILIQDADLEYDLEDYEVLLEPLVQGREAFVLGSRHGGNAWKMRHFEDQQLISTILNFGHWLFTMLVNILFGQHLKDPFTMYKVFRRDCLYGLNFECNRFDFDYELLIKLVRKGYQPIEIPVNYRSRSFREGKKVSAFRDPLTWLQILAKLRLSSINPMRVIQQRREAQHRPSST